MWPDVKAALVVLPLIGSDVRMTDPHRVDIAAVSVNISFCGQFRLDSL